MVASRRAFRETRARHPGRPGDKDSGQRKVLPMRYLRLLFVVVLAAVLVVVALANRQFVDVSLIPAGLDQWVPGDWSTRMPLFLIILLAILAGMLLGVVWEWLREAALRRESAQRAHELQLLEREVGSLRKTHHAPRDEVLAILDAPRPATPALPAKS